MIKLYNSLSRKKEPLPEAKKLRLFVCGPTVYDYPHIGHARTYIFFDFFAKYLRSQGYEVEYLQNITDIDDKIIKRAAEDSKEPSELAKFFTNVYFEDMRAIGVDGITKYARATEFIPEIINQVQRLIKKGYAYKIERDGWYFDISKDADYGKLSGRTIEQAEDAVSRIDEAVGKKNKGDFCLWKFSKPGEPVWDTPIGAGRPGWHIEDTAISEYIFKSPQYEIHGGGVDLKFPHHEAEIAQQESASGLKPFVKIWMHTGTLLVDGKKMSKSLENFITIRDFLKKYDADVLRWITLTHHYRSPIDFSDESAQQAEVAIRGIKYLLAEFEFIIKTGSKQSQGEHFGASFVMQKTDEVFNVALEDDLDTQSAIVHIFSIVEDYLEDERKVKIWDIEPNAAEILGKYIRDKFEILGFHFKLPEIPSKIKELAEKRETFRVNKQFIQSDALRKEVDALGYIIEDTPLGPFLWPKNLDSNSRRKT